MGAACLMMVVGWKMMRRIDRSVMRLVREDRDKQACWEIQRLRIILPWVVSTFLWQSVPVYERDIPRFFAGPSVPFPCR